MNIQRIQSEFYEAKQHFSYVEMHPTSSGNVYIKAALQTLYQLYIVSIYFPDSYPNELPKVYIVKPQIDTWKHCFNKGNICYLHPSMWNPGIHNISFVLARTAKWLSKYEIWKQKGNWPGASIGH